MKIEDITVNRQTIWLTFDPYKKLNDEGMYEEVPDKISVYYSPERPDGISNGEQIKDGNGEVIFFSSSEEAREQTENHLKQIIYPPDFLHPMEYRTSSMPEIMFKTLRFDLGPGNEDKITSSIKGKIIHCLTASDSYELPYSVTIEDIAGNRRKFRMLEIKNIGF